MSDLTLSDATGDVILENGDLVLNSGSEAVRQYLRSKLRTFLGEWFLDGSRGVPYYEEVFKKAVNPIVVDSIFKEQILETPGVIELLSFELDIDSATRKLTASFEVRTKEGVISFEETIP